ncbi:MAG: hypothetical protein NVS2B1_18190 [Bradyrhizobium sp.]
MSPAAPLPMFHTVLAGILGTAPELDLLFFQRLSAGPPGRYHENFTACSARLRW